MCGGPIAGRYYPISDQWRVARAIIACHRRADDSALLLWVYKPAVQPFTIERIYKYPMIPIMPKRIKTHKYQKSTESKNFYIEPRIYCKTT